MSKVYVVTYHTESGDRGVLGWCNRKPSKSDLRRLLEQMMPGEFEDGVCYVHANVELAEELEF